MRHGTRHSYGRSAFLSKPAVREAHAAQRRFAIDEFSQGYADAAAGRPKRLNAGKSYDAGFAAIHGHEHDFDLLDKSLVGGNGFCPCGSSRVLAGA